MNQTVIKIGIILLLAACDHVSDDLIRAVDRYVLISPRGVGAEDFPAMQGDEGRTWPCQSEESS